MTFAIGEKILVELRQHQRVRKKNATGYNETPALWKTAKIIAITDALVTVEFRTPTGLRKKSVPHNKVRKT